MHQDSLDSLGAYHQARLIIDRKAQMRRAPAAVRAPSQLSKAGRAKVRGESMDEKGAAAYSQEDRSRIAVLPFAYAGEDSDDE